MTQPTCTERVRGSGAHDGICGATMLDGGVCPASEHHLSFGERADMLPPADIALDYWSRWPLFDVAQTTH